MHQSRGSCLARIAEKGTGYVIQIHPAVAGFHLSLQGVKHRLQLGRLVRHQTHHRLRPPHAAQLVDDAKHRVELRANEHLLQAKRWITSTAQEVPSHGRVERLESAGYKVFPRDSEIAVKKGILF